MDITNINISIEGLAGIMFDRFVDHSKDVRPPEQLLYLDKNNRLVLPSENIQAFFAGENPPGCAKAFEGKSGKEYIRLVHSHIVIQPSLIPFKRDGKESHFKDFDDDTLWWLSEFAPRTKLGSISVKQPSKKRPVLLTPWELSFQIKLVKNEKLTPDKIRNWLERGGINLALGTYRPRFGRFMVKTFEVK